jgi:hypothetical protein
MYSCLFNRNVRPADQAADPEALDVAHGVPPPRAAPALLRLNVDNKSEKSMSISVTHQGIIQWKFTEYNMKALFLQSRAGYDLYI